MLQKENAKGLRTFLACVSSNVRGERMSASSISTQEELFLGWRPTARNGAPTGEMPEFHHKLRSLEKSVHCGIHRLHSSQLNKQNDGCWNKDEGRSEKKHKTK